MARSTFRVYCAGPLFNRKEQEEMAELANALERAGYSTFLPQRDGLELTKCIDRLLADGFAPDRASRLMSEAVFALDVYQVLNGCDAVVANLNGRVPDEGAVSEVAMAWARGKIVIGYKADSRSAFEGQDNPLVAGLFQFRFSRTPEEAVNALSDARKTYAVKGLPEAREAEIEGHAVLGEKIWSILQTERDISQLVDLIVRHEAVDTVGRI